MGHIGRQERHQGNRRRHRETGGDIRRQGRQEETGGDMGRHKETGETGKTQGDNFRH